MEEDLCILFLAHSFSSLIFMYLKGRVTREGETSLASTESCSIWLQWPALDLAKARSQVSTRCHTGMEELKHLGHFLLLSQEHFRELN